MRDLTEAEREIVSLHGLWLRDDPNGQCANLRHADLWNANLRGAYLRGANLEDANLSRADLEGADLLGTDLEGADLRGARLWNANLEGARLWNANLRGAYLRDANLAGAAAIDGGQDHRGFRFVGVPHDDCVMVLAGCRWLSLHDAWAHWRHRHNDKPDLRSECLAKLALIETVAQARGWALGYDPAALPKAKGKTE